MCSAIGIRNNANPGPGLILLAFFWPGIAIFLCWYLRLFETLADRRRPYFSTVQNHWSYLVRARHLKTRVEQYPNVVCLQKQWARVQQWLNDNYLLIRHFDGSRRPLSKERLRDLRKHCSDCAKELAKLDLFLQKLDRFESDRTELLTRADESLQYLLNKLNSEELRLTKEVDDVWARFNGAVDALRAVDLEEPQDNPFLYLIECQLMITELNRMLRPPVIRSEVVNRILARYSTPTVARR